MSHDVSVFNFVLSFKGLEANTLNFKDKNYVFFKFRETKSFDYFKFNNKQSHTLFRIMCRMWIVVSIFYGWCENSVWVWSNN